MRELEGCCEMDSSTMKMEIDRRYLSVLKGLLIVLVVVGHFGQTIANNLPRCVAFTVQGIILFIYLFHMPLFLFVSGYLSKHEEKRRRKAFGDLFIPYIVFQVIVGLCMAVFAKKGELIRNIFMPQLGAWYLLTLFSYRLVLPEVKRVRCVMVLSILITVMTCLGSFSGEFAIKKTLGFFVYFMAGYKMSELPRNRMPAWVARVGLAVVGGLLILISYRVDWYSIALLVLSRGADSKSFSQWYFAPLTYFLAFAVTSLVMLFVLNAIPERCKWLEKLGADTMPMYLSHLILFMAIGYVVNKSNWMLTVTISCLATIFSVIIFSSELYRKIFNIFMKKTRNVILKEG